MHSSSSPPGPLVVVAAALFDGRSLLAAQRSGPPALAGLWELPGGKVEPGEQEQDALVRECREELGVEVDLQERVGGDWAVTGRPPGTAVLRVWRASVRSGKPAAGSSHLRVEWLPPERWYSVPWLEADLPILRALESQGPASVTGR